jgi:hypothetical protein
VAGLIVLLIDPLCFFFFLSFLALELVKDLKKFGIRIFRLPRQAGVPGRFDCVWTATI